MFRPPLLHVHQSRELPDRITKVGEVEVRGLPEGAVFSPDGRWLYVGNYMDEDISVLRVDGETVTNTGTLLKLQGKPASMRGRTL